MTKSRPIQVTDVILRDAHQSLIATRMRTEDMLPRSEEHTSELQSLRHLVCRLLLEKKKKKKRTKKKKKQRAVIGMREAKDCTYTEK